MCFDLSDIIDDSETTTKSTISASEALLKAADLIDEKGFSKTAYGSNEAGKLTALGAIKKVALGHETEWLTGSDFAPEYERINDWFLVNKGNKFYYWTSRPAASRIRVVQAMRKAAAELAR